MREVENLNATPSRRSAGRTRGTYLSTYDAADTQTEPLAVGNTEHERCREEERNTLSGKSKRHFLLPKVNKKER